MAPHQVWDAASTAPAHPDACCELRCFHGCGKSILREKGTKFYRKFWTVLCLGDGDMLGLPAQPVHEMGGICVHCLLRPYHKVCSRDEPHLRLRRCFRSFSAKLEGWSLFSTSVCTNPNLSPERTADEAHVAPHKHAVPKAASWSEAKKPLWT